MLNKPKQKIFRVITLPFLTTHVTSSSCESYYVRVENSVIAWPFRIHSISSKQTLKEKTCHICMLNIFFLIDFTDTHVTTFNIVLVPEQEWMYMSLSLFWKDFLMAIQYHGLTYLSTCLFLFYLNVFLNPIQSPQILLLLVIAFHTTINSSTPGLQRNWLFVHI